MSWKENKFGLLALFFAVLPVFMVFVILLGLLGPSIYTFIAFLVLLISPFVSVFFVSISNWKKEKQKTHRNIALWISGATIILFIVIILFSIMPCCIPTPIRNQPIVGAAEALEGAYPSKSLLVTSPKVTFTQGNHILSRLAIVERANIGISREQLCLSLGDFGGFDAGFEGGVENSMEEKITYTGDGSRDLKISVLCNIGEELPDLLKGGTEEIYEKVESAWASSCSCVTDPELKEQICCLMVLRVVR